jgi:preprotein translocase subunit YajC
MSLFSTPFLAQAAPDAPSNTAAPAPAAAAINPANNALPVAGPAPTPAAAAAPAAAPAPIAAPAADANSALPIAGQAPAPGTAPLQTTGPAATTNTAATGPAAAPGTIVVPPAPGTATKPPPAATDGILGTFLPLGLLFVAMWFLLIRPQQKREKEIRKNQAALKNGDPVVTTAGIFGKVVGIDGDRVTLQVAEGVRIAFQRSAILLTQPAAEHPHQKK